MPLKGQKKKLEPICHWCKRDMEADRGFRTPLYGGKNDYAKGFLGGWVVCSPECTARPDDEIVFHKDDLDAN